MSCGTRRSDAVVSFLVVAEAELCYKISEGLHRSAKELQWNINVHQCEFVADIIKQTPNLGVDFVIFAVDSRLTQSLSDVETSINQIDQHFIISGAVCLVNCNGVSNLALNSHRSMKIRDKYNIRFMSANVYKPEACFHLGNRILNLTEAIYGLSSGIPSMAL